MADDGHFSWGDDSWGDDHAWDGDDVDWRDPSPTQPILPALPWTGQPEQHPPSYPYGATAYEPQYGTQQGPQHGPAPSYGAAGPYLPPDAPHQHPVPPPEPQPHQAGWGWMVAVIALIVAGAMVAAAFWYFGDDDTPDIEVDGRPLTNAAGVLSEAEADFDVLAEADGATPAAGAGCWFAPPVDRSAVGLGPRIACGPVLLGVSGTDKPWVMGRAAYTRSRDGKRATGAFDSFESAARPSTREFIHPDGREVPDASNLRPATGGIRAADGRRLTGDQDLIAGVDRTFATAAEEAGASVSPDSACFFGGRKNESDQFLTDGSLWCGPVLVRGSTDPSKAWAKSTFTTEAGDNFALAKAVPPISFELGTTVGLDFGVGLVRPDGRTPADASGIAPPEAAPLERGATRIVPELPSDVALTAPGDGRLHTPSRRVRLTGLGRVARVGAGPEALVAAEGDVLVVAAFESAAVEGGPTDVGNALVDVDGEKRPLDEWGNLTGTGALVVSVPADAGDVALEVNFQGRAQQISLVTGDKAAGFPAALYRERTSITPGAELRASVRLPVGAPVSGGGMVSEARLVPWLAGPGWAPEGQAYLVVTIADWKLDPGCCDGDVKVAPLFNFTPTGAARTDALAMADLGRPAPVFVVPAGLTTGTIELRLVASFGQDGRPGSVAGPPTALAIELPS